VEYAIGVLLAFGALVAAAFIGLDREWAFYPTVLIAPAILLRRRHAVS
jgi:hypothetical protein